MRRIYEHIAFKLLSPDDAADQAVRLEKHISELNCFPEKYRPYPNEPWYSRGMKIIPVDNYIVLFIPDQAGRDSNCESCYVYGQEYRHTDEGI